MHDPKNLLKSLEEGKSDRMRALEVRELADIFLDNPDLMMVMDELTERCNVEMNLNKRCETLVRMRDMLNCMLHRRTIMSLMESMDERPEF